MIAGGFITFGFSTYCETIGKRVLATPDLNQDGFPDSIYVEKSKCEVVGNMETFKTVGADLRDASGFVLATLVIDKQSSTTKFRLLQSSPVRSSPNEKSFSVGDGVRTPEGIESSIREIIFTVDPSYRLVNSAAVLSNGRQYDLRTAGLSPTLVCAPVTGGNF